MINHKDVSIIMQNRYNQNLIFIWLIRKGGQGWINQGFIRIE
jgi:hypothetical protein